LGPGGKKFLTCAEKYLYWRLQWFLFLKTPQFFSPSAPEGASIHFPPADQSPEGQEHICRVLGLF
jgi:hypothetical protein